MKKIKIGIAGLGTVGRGVYEILKKDAKILTRRTGIEFEVVAVSSRSKKDFVESGIKFYPNAVDLANDEEIDIIVELIGGKDVAKKLIESSLKNHKKVVTANKALLAECGEEIADLVEKNKGVIGYEASTAGANPIIKAFKEGFVANEIKEIYAILNGTCNFILTKMKNEGQDYAEALKEAQDLGFAEIDPTFDVEGIDTAHKIVLLSAIANGAKPNFKDTYIEGIKKISIDDIILANDLGYKIKLLAIYKNLGQKIQQSVYPALIKNSEKISQVDGSYNAILSLGSNFEYNLMIGRGAGGHTTGSAVVADIVDIACGRNNSFLFNAENRNLADLNIQKIEERVGKYFVRFSFDKNLASKVNVVEQFFANKIKSSQAVFKEKNFAEKTKIICAILTEDHSETEIKSSIESLDKNIVEEVNFIRVEETKF